MQCICHKIFGNEPGIQTLDSMQPLSSLVSASAPEFFGLHKKYHLSGLGKTFAEKIHLLSGIAQISETPPPAPQFGQLGPLFFRTPKQRFTHMTGKKYQ